MALMEEVLRVHHTTLRSLLDKHNGYESATEGDSFILAFHSPSDALAYAIEAQQCLLAAAWPHDLLTDFEEARAVEAAMYVLGHCSLPLLLCNHLHFFLIYPSVCCRAVTCNLRPSHAILRPSH
jgi:hypothetical protein